MTITLYGIPNCDTVRKARAWLDAHHVAYSFHDYKKHGADPARIASWVGARGWTVILNRSGTTFRTLPEDQRAGLDAAKAVALMAANPSCIKRPILEKDGRLLAVGFKPAEWSDVF